MVPTRLRTKNSFPFPTAQIVYTDLSLPSLSQTHTLTHTRAHTHSLSLYFSLSLSLRSSLLLKDTCDRQKFCHPQKTFFVYFPLFLSPFSWWRCSSETVFNLFHRLLPSTYVCELRLSSSFFSFSTFSKSVKNWKIFLFLSLSLSRRAQNHNKNAAYQKSEWIGWWWFKRK